MNKLTIWRPARNRIYCMDAFLFLRSLPTNSVNCIVTSPPYYNLRDYSVAGQIGLEPTPDQFVATMVALFREARRVLREDGVLWLNLGDSYSSGSRRDRVTQTLQKGQIGTNQRPPNGGITGKNLLGIPWRVALALQADGWILRSDVIWCLSGGAMVYVQTQKGEMPMMVRDLARLNPATVKLWNGEKWTRLLGMNRNKRNGDELEIVLRSGERISCTPTHRFPTNRGLLTASELCAGDILQSCQLPEPEKVRDCAIDQDAAWLAGLYIAEGSRSDDTIQIAGHAKETERWDRVQAIAAKFGGYTSRTIEGNNQSIRIHGKVLNAILDELVTGHTSKDKAFAPVVWRYSNRFIEAMLDGYLSGDGHYDASNDRWRLGFTRNYNLERDLRVACARLGYRLTLNLASMPYDGRRVATFRGEIRKSRSGHHNERNMGEIAEIRKARCREVYDLGVEDEPHLFSLASGILTHNSKPNPMPESVTDRPTKAHEYCFLLTKSGRYWWDAEAVREPNSKGSIDRFGIGENGSTRKWNTTNNKRDKRSDGTKSSEGFRDYVPLSRNLRTVWEVATEPTPFAHFATFPRKLIEPMIKAGCPDKVCSKCGKPWERAVERETNWQERRLAGAIGDNRKAENVHQKGTHGDGMSHDLGTIAIKDLGLYPACQCNTEPQPGLALDMFMGSGTTGLVARSLGRDYVGCDLNPDYVKLAQSRLELPLLDLIEQPELVEAGK